MSKKSYNFKYCSSDIIRESPLPFRIQDYPPDCVIDPTGEPISKLSKKLFSVLENKEYDLDSIVLECQQRFSRKLINGMEKLDNGSDKDKGLRIKTEIHPNYLWLQMPEGSAHKSVRRDLDEFIIRALNARGRRYMASGDDSVEFIQGGWDSSIKPDCSFLAFARQIQCQENGEELLIPNLVVEVGSSQKPNHLFNKVGSWFSIANDLGHVVNMVLSVDMIYYHRTGNRNVRTEATSRGRLHSMKFSLFVAVESTQQVPPGGGDHITIDMPEITTVELTTNDEGALQFVNNPQPLYPESGRRSPNYFQAPDNNLWFPVELLNGDVVNHNVPNILLTGQNMIEIFQQAYYRHEKEVAANNLP